MPKYVVIFKYDCCREFVVEAADPTEAYELASKKEVVDNGNFSSVSYFEYDIEEVKDGE